MTENLNKYKLELYALKQYYNPKDCHFMLKRSWEPKEWVKEDSLFLNVLLPNPNFCSNYLVYDSKKKIINNIYFLNVNADPENNKTFNGTFTLKDYQLRNMLDDRHLYNNVLTEDGDVMTYFGSKPKVNSFVITICKMAPNVVYFSRPLNISNFVTEIKDYSNRKYVDECKSNVLARKGYVDNRPLCPGSLYHTFMTNNEYGDNSPTFKYNSYSYTFPWQLIHENVRNVEDLNRMYPVKLKEQKEILTAINSIKDSEVNIHVGIYGVGDGKHKTLKKINMNPNVLSSIYDSYKKELSQEVNNLSGYLAKKGTILNWIKSKYVNFIIFPVYSWYTTYPLKYCQEDLL